MDEKTLNSLIQKLVRSPRNLQAFADVASPEENWRRVDKSIALPRTVGMDELECPECDKIIGLLYDKFSTGDFEEQFVCPHCTQTIACVGEFSGYTTEIHLESV